MAEGRGPALLLSLRLISLGLSLTAFFYPELQCSRAGAGCSALAPLNLPDGARTKVPPSGAQASCACALSPLTAAPPRSCPNLELLRLPPRQPY
jgi:hypothetical protein